MLTTIRCVVLVAFLCSLPRKADSQNPVLCSGNFESSNGKWVAQWNIVGGSIEFNISAMTDGWVGIGFSLDQMMPNSDTVIGAASTDNTQSFVYDGYATEHSLPPPDSIQDITEVKAEYVFGFTNVSFVRPIVTSDTRDLDLDKCVYVLWAFDGSVTGYQPPEIDYHYANRGVATTNQFCFPVEECQALGTSSSFTLSKSATIMTPKLSSSLSQLLPSSTKPIPTSISSPVSSVSSSAYTTSILSSKQVSSIRSLHSSSTSLAFSTNKPSMNSQFVSSNQVPLITKKYSSIDLTSMSSSSQISPSSTVSSSFNTDSYTSTRRILISSQALSTSTFPTADSTPSATPATSQTLSSQALPTSAPSTSTFSSSVITAHATPTTSQSLSSQALPTSAPSTSTFSSSVITAHATPTTSQSLSSPVSPTVAPPTNVFPSFSTISSPAHDTRYPGTSQTSSLTSTVTSAVSTAVEIPSHSQISPTSPVLTTNIPTSKVGFSHFTITSMFTSSKPLASQVTFPGDLSTSGSIPPYFTTTMSISTPINFSSVSMLSSPYPSTLYSTGAVVSAPNSEPRSFTLSTSPISTSSATYPSASSVLSTTMNMPISSEPSPSTSLSPLTIAFSSSLPSPFSSPELSSSNPTRNERTSLMTILASPSESVPVYTTSSSSTQGIFSTPALSSSQLSPFSSLITSNYNFTTMSQTTASLMVSNSVSSMNLTLFPTMTGAVESQSLIPPFLSSILTTSVVSMSTNVSVNVTSGYPLPSSSPSSLVSFISSPFIPSLITSSQSYTNSSATPIASSATAGSILLSRSILRNASSLVYSTHNLSSTTGSMMLTATPTTTSLGSSLQPSATQSPQNSSSLLTSSQMEVSYSGNTAIIETLSSIPRATSSMRILVSSSKESVELPEMTSTSTTPSSSPDHITHTPLPHSSDLRFSSAIEESNTTISFSVDHTFGTTNHTATFMATTIPFFTTSTMTATIMKAMTSATFVTETQTILTMATGTSMTSIQLPVRPTYTPPLGLQNALIIVISDYSESSFTAQVEVKFKTTLAMVINDYCITNPESCQYILAVSRKRQDIAITTDDVIILDTTKDDNGNLAVTTYVQTGSSIIAVDSLEKAVEFGKSEGIFDQAGFIIVDVTRAQEQSGLILTTMEIIGITTGGVALLILLIVGILVIGICIKKRRTIRYKFGSEFLADNNSFSSPGHKPKAIRIKMTSRTGDDDDEHYQSDDPSKQLVDDSAFMTSKHCVFGRQDTTF